MPGTLVDFLRHGEPVGGRRYRGDGADDPLSEKGWQQMWASVGEQPPWQRVVSSPMQRCSAFAEALVEKHRLPLRIEPRFREVGVGRWEGLPHAEIEARWPEEYKAFYLNPYRNRPQGAEPLSAFGQRVADAFDALLQEHPGEHVLVVAHAGVIRAALGYVLQSDPAAWYRTRVDNAAITRFLHDEHGIRLEFHNHMRLTV
jgi:broad specificity phosphatase PhoE